MLKQSNLSDEYGDDLRRLPFSLPSVVAANNTAHHPKTSGFLDNNPPPPLSLPLPDSHNFEYYLLANNNNNNNSSSSNHNHNHNHNTTNNNAAPLPTALLRPHGDCEPQRLDPCRLHRRNSKASVGSGVSSLGASAIPAGATHSRKRSLPLQNSQVYNPPPPHQSYNLSTQKASGASRPSSNYTGHGNSSSNQNANHNFSTGSFPLAPSSQPSHAQSQPQSQPQPQPQAQPQQQQQPVGSLGAQQALMAFISDFLRSRGLIRTLRTLYDESPAESLIPLEHLDMFCQEVNALRHGGKQQPSTGILAEWWQVFWSILQQQQQQSAKHNLPSPIPSSQAQPQPQPSSSKPSSLPNTSTVAPHRRPNQHIAIPIQSKNIPPGSLVDMAGASGSTSLGNHSLVNSSRSGLVDAAALLQSMSSPLDMVILGRIEKTLSSAGLMNKDLTRLPNDERTTLLKSLRLNNVSMESWAAYLQLCQEYTRYANSNNSNFSNSGKGAANTAASLPGSGTNPATAPQSSVALPAQASPVNMPQLVDSQVQSGAIDSRQLLMLRQSLHQQYLARSNPAAVNMGNYNADSMSHRAVAQAPTNGLPARSPMLINAPAMPLERPFYSPPKPKDPGPTQSAHNFMTDQNQSGAHSYASNDPFFHLYSNNTFSCLDIFDNSHSSGASSNPSTSHYGQPTVNSAPPGVIASSSTSDQLSDIESLLMGPPISSRSRSTAQNGAPASFFSSSPAQEMRVGDTEDSYHTMMSEFLDVS